MKQAPGNGWVRFLGGLCVFVGIAVFIIFCVWSYQTYKDVTEIDVPGTSQPSGVIVIGRSDQPIKSQEALIILAAGFLTALILEVLGEGLILIAQIREEQFQIIKKLDHLPSE